VDVTLEREEGQRNLNKRDNKREEVALLHSNVVKRILADTFLALMVLNNNNVGILVEWQSQEHLSQEWVITG